MNSIIDLVKPEFKDTIIQIKSELMKDPDYHKRFSSVDLYNAVCINGVKNLADFYKFIKLFDRS